MTTLRIIGYTDSVNECDCCGKTELKGTYVMANDCDGEFYYGTTCGAKAASWTVVEFKEKFKQFKAEQKNSFLIETYIAPLQKELAQKLSDCENSELAFIQRQIANIKSEYQRVINLRANKYKIAI